MMLEYNGIVPGYLLAASLITFVLFGADKWKAVHGKWRIRERTLLGFAAAGGAAGGLLAMKIFRHKTQKPCFAIGLPVMLAVQILAAFFFL